MGNGEGIFLAALLIFAALTVGYCMGDTEQDTKYHQELCVVKLDHATTGSDSLSIIKKDRYCATVITHSSQEE